MIKLPPILLCLLPSLMLACSPQSDTPSSSTESKVFEPTKTYCFGRFLVNLPMNAELSYQNNSYLMGMIYGGLGEQNYHTLINEKLEERKRQKDEYVRSEYPNKSDKQIIISKADLWGHISYSVDAFTINKREAQGDEHFFYISGNAYKPDRIEEVVTDYRNILSSLRYRPDDEIPKEAGFCFKDGFVANEGKNSQPEKVLLEFRLKDHPDVWIRISSDVAFVTEKTLIERFKTGGSEPWIREDSVRKRKVNGIKGDELLLSGLKDGIATHYYQWESRGEVNNPNKPSINLDIRTAEPVDGRPVTSSLSNEQVRALYEQVLKSIRFRPVDEVKAKPQSLAPEAVQP